MSQLRGSENYYFLRNPVDSPTRKNDSKLLIFAKDHFAKLKNEYEKSKEDGAIKDIYLETKPIHEAFIEAMNAINTAEKVYATFTQDVDEKLDDLIGVTGKLSLWDAQLLSLYGKKKKQYLKVIKLLFPHGRDPFNSGKKDKIIEEVHAVASAFATIVKPDTPEAELQATIQAYYEELDKERSEQTGKEKEVADAREQKRLKRDALVMKIHKNMLQLMLHFWPNKRRVLDFIEVKYLRRKGQSELENFTEDLPIDLEDITDSEEE